METDFSAFPASPAFPVISAAAVPRAMVCSKVLFPAAMAEAEFVRISTIVPLFNAFVFPLTLIFDIIVDVNKWK